MSGRMHESVHIAPDFWQAVDVVDVLRTRDVGRLFFLVRRWTGASQTRLAIATGVTQGQVSTIMNGGRRILTLDVLERLADGLAMPDPARMSLGLAPKQIHPASAPAAFGEAILTLSPDYHQALTSTLSDLLNTTGSDLHGTVSGDGQFQPEVFTKPSRDWLLARLAVAQPANTEPARVSTVEAQAIRDTFKAFQELDTKYGGYHARLAIVQYLRTIVMPLLQVSQSQTVRRELCGAASELVYLAGLTAFDSGECRLAQYYYVQALRLAQESTDDAFAANVFAAMAHCVSTHRDGEEAVRLAQAGLVAATKANSMPAVMRLEIAQARGLAAQGDQPGCAEAITRAETAMDKGERSEPRQWTRFLDPAYLAGEMAHCFLDLEQPALAEQFARQSVHTNSGRHRRLALSYAMLATAQAKLGELEAAQESSREAFQLASRIRSSRSLRALRDLDTALLGIDSSTARDMCEEITLLTAGVTVDNCCPRPSITSASNIL